MFDQPGTADLTADVNFGHIAGFLTKQPPNEEPTKGKVEMLGYVHIVNMDTCAHMCLYVYVYVWHRDP